MIVLDLAEESVATVVLDDDRGRLLARSGLVDASPSVQPGRWRVVTAGKVGVARVGDVEVRIRPKVPVARLLFLAGYGEHGKGWRRELVDIASDADLVPVVADVYAILLERALRRGPMQGYLARDETATVLRGRLREGDQLRRHHGRPLPLEIRHDEFTVDVPENRLLLGAARRVLRVPGVPVSSRGALSALARRLSDVTAPGRGEPRPVWRPSRLNAHLQPALRLADLIWQATSPDLGRGSAPVTAFLFDVWSLFERFVTTALAERLVERGGGRVPPRTRRFLDEGGRLGYFPDLLWTRDRQPAAVVDAKYKTGRPITDVYQVLAYCTSLGLDRGHLVYAEGETPARHVIKGSPIEIHTHVVTLDVPPAELLRRMDGIARAVVLDPSRAAEAC